MSLQSQTQDTLSQKRYKPNDFISVVPPKWCPGCGDHSVFKSLVNVLSTLDIPRENYVFVSGIGCSSRFPYYMNTYGFHTIHGRALTVATGIKFANPNLQVWVITGDGDALAIGGNHFIHLMRRNLDIKVVLFNNNIYGLTKGQVSPTSAKGFKTKTTPFGSIEPPVKPLLQAFSVGATFGARVLYSDVAMMKEVFTEAALHKGVAIIEVLTNCVIYANGVFEAFVKKEYKLDNTIKLEHGKPLVFGSQANKGICIEEFHPKIIEINTPEDLNKVTVHDVQREDEILAYILSSLEYPRFPLPLGIFRKIRKTTYEEELQKQREQIINQYGLGTVKELLHSGETWEIT